MNAVNEANLFRFLFKPAPRAALVAALDGAIEQRRLLTAEKDLLERTLTGSVDALSETLALTNPVAFGRSRRLKRIVSALAAEVGLTRKWTLEVAAMLSQLGAVTLPPDTAQRYYAGQPLTDTERKMIARSGEVTRQLLKHIPRMEPVIALLDPRPAVSGTPPSIEEGLLQVAMNLERRLSLAEPFEQALAAMEADPTLLQSAVAACHRLRNLVLDSGTHQKVPLLGLRAGMILVDDVKTAAGALLITKGHEVSAGLIARLKNFAATVGVREPLHVSRGTSEEPPLAATGT